jgi:hypothetical protein
VAKIELVPAVEQAGRDTISRFDMQFQAAAYAALEILNGVADCVYCDFHDDFVVRKLVDGRPSYHFFQVKTKKKLNHQWGLNDVFGMKKRGQGTDKASLERIRRSFAGKLLCHGIVFGDQCDEVTLLTNVHFEDGVIETVEELRCKSHKCAAATFLSKHFSAVFALEPEAAADSGTATLAKLSLRPGVSYIGEDREAFAGAARRAIHKYSEIDLDHYETQALANGLVDLVFKKSKTPLAGARPDDIERLVGIRLEDLLDALSISKGVYEAIRKDAEDPKALKTASTLQRWLGAAGASEPMIEFAAQKKVDWDLWLRNARHSYSPTMLETLFHAIDALFEEWMKTGPSMAALEELLSKASARQPVSKFPGLDRELVLGAVASVAVRKLSR